VIDHGGRLDLLAFLGEKGGGGSCGRLWAKRRLVSSRELSLDLSVKGGKKSRIWASHFVKKGDRVAAGGAGFVASVGMCWGKAQDF